MGGQNEQAYSRYWDKNGEMRNVLSKRRIGKARTVPEPPAKIVAMNEADTNSDTCCLGTSFILFAHMKRSAYLYPYNDAYDQIKNASIVSGATAYDHPNGGTYIFVFH